MKCQCVIDHAFETHVDDKNKCVLDSCENGYKTNKRSNKCDYQIGERCPDDVLQRLFPNAGAKTGKITVFNNDTVIACWRSYFCAKMGVRYDFKF